MTASIAGLILLPGLVMMVGGAVLIALRGPARAAWVVVVPAAVLALIWLLPEGTAAPVRWLGYDLVPFRSDALARLFGSAFAVAALAAGLFGLGQPRRLETPVAYLYAGGAIGVAFAGDLVTLFVFWEAMAFLAAVVVWLGGAGARGAGQRYIVVHVLGGVLLMAGIAGQVAATGSVAFVAMAADSPATWLILLGFLVNVAAWPFAAWLPDAYPAATWSGTVFLSAFTTKAAVLALIRGFPGAEVLVPVGLGMIVYGTLYAASVSDIRKLLSYALVAQLGFMVTATGIGSELALNGAAAHAVASIFYQALLFMVAGSVIVMTGKSDCAELGGLWRAMPVTAATAVVGALAIAAFPLTSGYVAKSVIVDAIAADGNAVAWFVVTAGAAGVVLHAGLRLPWSVFFGDGDARVASRDPPLSMKLAMMFLAVVTAGVGLFPSVFFGLLLGAVDVAPYGASHVVGQVQLLAFAGLGFVLLRRWRMPSRGIVLDVDWLWRYAGPRLYRAWRRHAVRGGAALAQRRLRGVERFVRGLYRHHGPQGVLARSWPTGSMAIWAVFMLGAYLVIYYF